LPVGLKFPFLSLNPKTNMFYYYFSLLKGFIW
jgi:hypothetical protein